MSPRRGVALRLIRQAYSEARRLRREIPRCRREHAVSVVQVRMRDSAPNMGTSRSRKSGQRRRGRGRPADFGERRRARQSHPLHACLGLACARSRDSPGRRAHDAVVRRRASNRAARSGTHPPARRRQPAGRFGRQACSAGCRSRASVAAPVRRRCRPLPRRARRRLRART